MRGVAPRGWIGLGEALDLTAIAMKVPGWRGWTWEIPVFHRAWILAADDRGTSSEDDLAAAIEDSRNVGDVMTRASGLFYGTPPLREDAVPILVIDGKGRSIPIPVGEWRREGTWQQLFIRRRWSPRHGAPAFAIFVRRVPLKEALARDFGATDGASQSETSAVAAVAEPLTQPDTPATVDAISHGPSKQDLDKVYLARIADGRYPTAAEDLNWGKSIGISRDRVRELRKRHLPSELHVGGAPKRSGKKLGGK